MAKWGKIGTFGSPEKITLKEDEIRIPSLRNFFLELKRLISVPRVYNKFYDGIKAKLSELTGWKKKLADHGVAKKLKNLKEKGVISHTIFDKLIFSKMKAITGGAIKFYMSGAAPVSSEVTDFLTIAFSTPFIEGYGQTETCAAAFAQIPSDTSSGNVGGPMTSVEFNLFPVARPDLGSL